MKKNEITEGIIWKQLLIFFFPILVGTFFQQLYNTVDALVLGQFDGEEALASAGGSAGQIANLVVGFFVGLTSGAAVLISRMYGGKNMEQLKLALHTAYTFSIFGGILLGIAGIALAPGMLSVMKTPDTIMADSQLYLQIYFAGLVFIFVYNMGASILRAVGDSRRPLYYLIIGTIVNIVLDVLFIAVFHWGVAGVAVATVLAQMVSAVLVTCTLMFKTEEFQLVLSKMRIHKRLLASMLFIGIPSGIQACLYSLSNMTVQTELNECGVDTMAAWTAFGKVDGMIWMVMGAFGIAITTFVGQNYGAGKWDRIYKGIRVCLLMTIAFSIFFSAVIMLSGEFLFGIFLKKSSVIAIGLRMMRVITPTYFFFAFIEIFSGSLRAQGHVMVTTIITLLGVCAYRVVWVLWVVPGGTLEQIIECYPLSWVMTAVAMTVYYLLQKFRWKIKSRCH